MWNRPLLCVHERAPAAFPIMQQQTPTAHPCPADVHTLGPDGPPCWRWWWWWSWCWISSSIYEFQAPGGRAEGGAGGGAPPGTPSGAEAGLHKGCAMMALCDALCSQTCCTRASSGLWTRALRLHTVCEYISRARAHASTCTQIVSGYHSRMATLGCWAHAFLLCVGHRLLGPCLPSVCWPLAAGPVPAFCVLATGCWAHTCLRLRRRLEAVCCIASMCCTKVTGCP